MEEIFEKEAIENAIVEAETLVEQADEEKLMHENAHIHEINAEINAEVIRRFWDYTN